MKHPNTEKEPGEDFNVRETHGQIWRENPEPFEKFNRIPWWLKHCIYGPLIMWAVWYMAVYSGGFKSEEYYEGDPLDYSSKPNPVQGLAASPQGKAVDGKAVYTKSCAACHQATGLGLPGAFPPLAGSDWVSGNPQRISAVVLHGLTGKITVNGTSYNGSMPPFGSQLSDAEIAAVLSYVRSEWGNSSAAVKAPTVTELRDAHKGHAPWTATQLKEAFGD